MRRLQQTVRTAERIIGAPLPPLQDLYFSRVRKRAGKVLMDPSHPGHHLFDLLPSGRRFRSLSTRTSQNRSSFFPQARSLNRPDNSDFQTWDLLTGIITDYKFVSFRYRGRFSEVAQCRMMDTKDTMAIKIFNKRTSDSRRPSRELAVLRKLRCVDPIHVVRFYERLQHKGHTCLVFEMLDKSLDELLRERHREPLSLHVIRSITQQLLSALNSLKTAGIIHTNIKPHNVMLVKQEDLQPIRVKLTGFGSAIQAAEVKRSSIMQPVGYMSPDVILGLPISPAVDMWSVGAVLTTMYLGSPLFPQRCQYHLMKTLVKTLGQPEDELLSEGTNTLLYFNSTEHTWTLKTPDEYNAMTGFLPHILSDSTRFNSLSELVELYPDVDTSDKMPFVSLLRKMLHLNPQKRISPTDALKHSFVTRSKEDNSDCSSHDMVSVSSVSISSVAKSAKEGGTSANLNKHSAASRSGVENVPAVCCKDKASAGAAALANADAGRNDTVPAVAEASETSALLENGTTSAGEHPKADVNEAALALASTTIVSTDLNDAVPADQDPVEASTAAELFAEVMAEAHETKKALRKLLKRVRK
ncbi:homeodomain-interacting protein kinase 1-like, partial [Stegastes partitus]|uniref:Homeodomain-interacting protein kinase 1-like n=1 Tax=Stegastes partitus TaxID=144197 RepID=A0A9Y4NQP4_9TELE